jgi:hypothetical protein
VPPRRVKKSAALRAKPAKIIRKEKKPVESPVEEPSVPVDPKPAGWKTPKKKKSSKKAKSWKAAKTHPKKSKILRPRTETWELAREAQVEQRASGDVTEKGLFIIIDGQHKSGRSHAALSIVNFEGIEGTRRSLPPAKPIMLIATEDSVIDEAEFSYAEEINSGDIIVVDGRVFDEHNHFDPAATWKKIRQFAYSAQPADGEPLTGTLIIDSWSVAAQCVYYVLLERLGIDYIVEETIGNEIHPTQHIWKKREWAKFVSVLRRSGLHIILVRDVKERGVKTGEGAYDYKKTGEFVGVGAQEFEDAAADLICWVEKHDEIDESGVQTGRVTRSIRIVDSKFEAGFVESEKMVVSAPNLDLRDVIAIFGDVL